MTIEIRRWDNQELLFSSDQANTLAEAVVEAVKAETGLYRANLVGANLYRASLVGANLDGASLYRAISVGANLDGARLCRAILDGANLYRASLVGANLVGARLYRAILVGANLVGANLDGARLDGASLYRASLDGANLYRASLDGANLYRASLVGARLDGARLDGARLDGANLGQDIDLAALTVPSLHRRMLAEIESGRVGFCMSDWHCGTTHCRAGLCVVLAGEAGLKLESASDTATAGAIITALSSPGVLPKFYASDEDALNDIREAAEKEPELTP